MYKIDVKYAGLCGSDIAHILTDTMTIPFTEMGHEIVGIINETDEKKHNNYEKGDWVIINPFISQKEGIVLSQNYIFDENFLSYGKNLKGGFSGEISVPRASVVPIPHTVGDKSVGILADGIAVVFHSIYKCQRVFKHSDNILIIGSGSIACLLAIVSKTFGKSVFIKIRNTEKGNKVSKILSDFGINIIYNKFDCNSKFDLVFEAVGGKQIDTIEEAISQAKEQGTICILGAFYNTNKTFDVRNLFQKEITLKGINSYGSKDFDNAVNWLFSNWEKVVPLITKYETSSLQDIYNNIVNKEYMREIKVAIIP